jgi:hypothetical protein
MTDDPAKPLRFPYVAAFLCAVCLGAAACTWMLYSYAWPVAPSDIHALAVLPEGGLQQSWCHIQGFVCVRGRLQAVDDPRWYYHSEQEKLPSPPDRTLLLGDPKGFVFVVYKSKSEARRHVGRPATLRGRVLIRGDHLLPRYAPVLDTTASRWHGGSIAGLVVGAMGVFVFSAALRHWLGERRKFREEAKGHTPSVDRPHSAS